MFSSLHTVKDKVKSNPLSSNKGKIKLNFSIKDVKKKYRDEVSKTENYDEIDYSSAKTNEVSSSTGAVTANQTKVVSYATLISILASLFGGLGCVLGFFGMKLIQLLIKKGKIKLYKDNEYVIIDQNLAIGDPSNKDSDVDNKELDKDTEQKKNDEKKKEEEKKRKEEEDKKKKEEEKKRKEEEDKKKKEEEDKKKKEEENKKNDTKQTYVANINKIGLNITATDIKNIKTDGNNTIVELNNGVNIVLNNQTVSKIITSDNEYYYKNGHLVGSKNFVGLFSEKTNSTGQYGGAQQDFTNNIDELSKDPIIKNTIKEFYNVDDTQSVRTLLESIECCGCNFVAIATAIMKKYQGREEDFYNTFGYDMYKIDKNGNVDFNYERLVVEEFCYFRTHNFDFEGDGIYDSYGSSTVQGAKYIKTGLNNQGAQVCYEYLQNKYNFDGTFEFKNDGTLLTREEIEDYLNQGRSVVICTNSYTLNNTGYVKQGSFTSFSEMGYGGHGMTITGFDDYGNMLVSSWGNEFTISVQNPGGSFFTYYEIM